MVIDRQGASEGSLQSCWLHSCWWGYWWKQRNSCPCGHCWHQPHLHPELWLLCSPIERNTDKIISGQFQYRLSQICNNTWVLSVSPYLVSPSFYYWTEAPASTLCSAAVAAFTSLSASQQRTEIHPTLHSLSLFLSTPCWMVLLDLRILFDKLKKDFLMYNFIIWIWQSAIRFTHWIMLFFFTAKELQHGLRSLRSLSSPR